MASKIITVHLTPLRRQALEAGLALLVKAQESAAKTEDTAGNKEYAEGCRKLAARITSEGERIQATGADAEFNSVQAEWASRSVELFVRNMRAATGTMKGLKEDEIAEKLAAKATRINDDFLPEFGGQISIPIAEPEQPKKGRQMSMGEQPSNEGEGKTLRQLADEEAAREAKEQEADAGTRGGREPKKRLQHRPAQPKKKR